MDKGALYYDGGAGRYSILFEGGRDCGGLHCGETFEALIGGEWQQARIELGDDGAWNLAGRHAGAPLDGLIVRA
jgi:hypothetical protein